MDKLQIYMPQGKVAKQELEQKLRNMYLDGDIDPLQVEIGVKGIEDAIKYVRKEPLVRNTVLEAVSMYNEKTFEINGAQIQKKNMPARYDFTVCQDPVWVSLNAQMESLKDRIKERETFLKALPGKTTIVNDDTGEVTEIYPPAKSQGETIAIKFL